MSEQAAPVVASTAATAPPGGVPGSAGTAPSGSTAALAAAHAARGRPRVDGLRPGSPEAAAADRLKAIERKRRFRLRQKDALASLGDSVPQPPPHDNEGVESGDDVPAVPWRQDPLRPLCRALSEGIEAIMVASLVGDCRKLKLPPEVVSAVGKKAQWPDAAKLTLNETAPACAVEVLDAAGIPADKAHWVGLVGAAGMIGAHFVALKRELAAEMAKIRPVEPAKADASPSAA